MDLFERMLDLSNEGFACAQIMMILTLESEGKEDPNLIRAMGALNNGIRDTGQTCGAFLGGACILSYFASMGEPDEVSDENFDAMTQELFTWFNNEFATVYGGITCPCILEGDKKNKLERCPNLVETTYGKAFEILEKYELL